MDCAVRRGAPSCASVARNAPSRKPRNPAAPALRNALRRREISPIRSSAVLSFAPDQQHLQRFFDQDGSSRRIVQISDFEQAVADRGIIRWQLRWSENETDRVRGVNIMRVRDGKIVEGLGYVKG